MARCTPHSYHSFGRGYRPGRQWGKWRLIPSIFLLLVPAHTSAQAWRPSGEFRISTDVELVLLDVSVKQARGGYVSGLTKNNFQIYENGRLQKITEFASADIPVAVGLVFDDSGSMRSKRPDVITAGLVFIGASNPQDQIFVVNFNDKVRRGLPETVPLLTPSNCSGRPFKILHKARPRCTMLWPLF